MTQQVTGQVPGTSVVFNSRAWNNRSEKDKPIAETLNGSIDTSSTNGFTNLSQAKYDTDRRTEVAIWNAFVNSLPASRQLQAGPPPLRPQSTNVYADPGIGVEAPNAETPLMVTKNPTVQQRLLWEHWRESRSICLARTPRIEGHCSSKRRET